MRGAFLPAILIALAAAGCSKEVRTLEPDGPQTAPGGNDDPRARWIEGNVDQVAQGGRYFTWYGCGGCHGADARGVLALGDGAWRHGGGPADIYDAILRRHTRLGYGARIPASQLWQITAYVRQLPALTSERRRRQDADLAGEPQGTSWNGPLG